MEWKVGKLKLHKAGVVIALFHFLISFLTDRLIFQYTVFDFSDLKNTAKSVETVTVKICFLALVLFLWQWLPWFFRSADKTFRRVAIGYFFVQILLLLLIWPGIWRMDEFGILSSAIHLYPSFWQNYLTSVFYIFALMLLPFPSGVIVMQAAVISLMASRVFCNLSGLCGKKKNNVDNSFSEGGETTGKAEIEQSSQWGEKTGQIAGFHPKHCWVLLIPFVMLPVLDSDLYPMRMNIWAFLELTILSELYVIAKHRRQGDSCKNKDNDRNNARRAAKSLTAETNKLSDKFSTTLVSNGGKLTVKMVLICVSAAVLTVWRTEAIYYLILFPILLLLLEKRKSFKAILVFFIFFVLLFVPQKIGERMESGQQYELTGMVLPLVQLVEKAHTSGTEEDLALLNEIDQVINVEVTLKGVAEGKNGINLFWGEPDFQRSYTPQQFSAAKRAYYKLILRYPEVFLQERLENFLQSKDLLMDTTKLTADMDNPNHAAFAEYPLSAPLSDGVRSAVIRFLELRQHRDYDQKLGIYDFVYAPLWPILILTAGLIFFIMKRDLAGVAVLACSLIKVPLIILTAPSRLFMYYYPVYLAGYVLLFAFLCYLADGYLLKKNEREDHHG
ncbi:MAG: hypothetical protein K6E75_08060 [Lachnospiraceae bacterium]|nr:hypothetical protein [Lachnospiraceae bacterium]